MRARAVAYALWFAVAPTRLYESSPHYAPMGYWEHAGMNVRLAGRWLARRETTADREFERDVNGNG